MRESRAIRVIVARFEPVIARGLAAVLGDDRRLLVLQNGLSHAALLQAVTRFAPQVVILDEAAERMVRGRLRSTDPATGILVFAHKPALRYGMMLLAAGATCVTRSAPPAEIVAAVHLVAEGGRMFTSADGQRLERRCPENVPPLTRREREVLERLSQGMQHKQIAHELQIGVRTVHTYTSQICRKWGLRTKRDLIGMPIPAEVARD